MTDSVVFLVVSSAVVCFCVVVVTVDDGFSSVDKVVVSLTASVVFVMNDAVAGLLSVVLSVFFVLVVVGVVLRVFEGVFSVLVKVLSVAFVVLATVLFVGVIVVCVVVVSVVS